MVRQKEEEECSFSGSFFARTPTWISRDKSKGIQRWYKTAKQDKVMNDLFWMIINHVMVGPIIVFLGVRLRIIHTELIRTLATTQNKLVPRIFFPFMDV